MPSNLREEYKCHELLNATSYRPRSSNVVDFRKFRILHHYGRKQIEKWFRRGWEMRDCADDESFEPFIFTWIAFNGWTACVTEEDRDSNQIKLLMNNQEMYDRFAQFLGGLRPPLSETVAVFYKLWPIFKVQDIRRRNVRWFDIGMSNRIEAVDYYLENNIAHGPSCWKWHRDNNEPVPHDWPHTLAALYNVRCNLFHGDKSLTSENDIQVVAGAFRTLVYFLHESRLLES